MSIRISTLQQPCGKILYHINALYVSGMLEDKQKEESQIVWIEFVFILT